jgi:hypothetical protein
MSYILILKIKIKIHYKINWITLKTQNPIYETLYFYSHNFHFWKMSWQPPSITKLKFRFAHASNFLPISNGQQQTNNKDMQENDPIHPMIYFNS